MQFNISSDTNSEVKIDQIFLNFSAREIRDILYFKNYGNDLVDIFVVLMCRNPEYNFKQRIRMDRKNKILYLDLMLDYYYFTSNATPEDRTQAVAKKIIDEVPPIVKKYKLKDFHLDSFMNDIEEYFKKINWI